MNRLAIFASGSGTNAENIIKHFYYSDDCEISVLISNKSDAYALTRAENLGVKTCCVTKADFTEGRVLSMLIEMGVNYVVLAGFLLLIPKEIVEYYNNRIINIHPSLLPKYGGKGMYGSNIHKAVSENGDTKTGITIHLVNEELDKGDFIFQAECEIDKNEDPVSIEAKIHQLEKQYFPEIIENFITNK